MPLALVAHKFELGRKLDEDLQTMFRSLPTKGGAAHRLASDLFTLSVLHGGALRLLFSEQRPLSALALLRPQLEACLRGLWVLHQGDAFAEPYMRDLAKGESIGVQLPKNVNKLFEHLARSEAHHDVAAELKSYWTFVESALHEYTHGGRISLQLIDGIEIRRIADALDHSGAVSVIAYSLLTLTAECTSHFEQKVMERLMNELSARRLPHPSGY